VPTNKQRREAERRHLERQLRNRRVREAKRRKVTLITSVALTIVLIGAIVVTVVLLGSGNDNNKTASASSSSASASGSASATTSASTSASASASASTSAAPSYPCSWTKDTASKAAKKVSVPSTTTPPKTGVVTVSVKTTQGPMTFTLNRAGSPCTVASFLSLVAQKFYDATPCHRLVTTGIYVLQCGDPTGTGSGGPGYTVPDEATGHEAYPAGTIAMARTQAAHSGGSQFFIVFKDSPNLAQNLGALQYTVFGKVSAGLSVVTKVAAKGSDNSNGSGDGKPKLPISISTMRQAH
jgi:peptidyl-prolyl cis-trans isomerase B (cyclophilin B)